MGFYYALLGHLLIDKQQQPPHAWWAWIDRFWPSHEKGRRLHELQKKDRGRGWTSIAVADNGNLARPHAVSEHLRTSSMLRSQACRRVLGSDSDDVQFGHSATPTFAASRHYQEAVLVPRRRTAAGAFIVPMQGGPADLRSRPGVTYRRQRMHACMASSVQGWSWSWCIYGRAAQQ